ncbi:MAG: glycosyltransferase family 2 protein [bacterium]
MNKELSIIIVNWNVSRELNKCIKSIVEKTKNIDFEIIIVDNNSMDCDIWEVGKRWPQSYIIHNKVNFGFATAVNQGIGKAKGEYILLLNPDVLIPDENTLRSFIDQAKDIKNLGVAGCKILNYDGSIQESVRRFPDIKSQSLILLKLHQLFKLKAIKNYLAKSFDYDYSDSVDQVMGAAFLISQTAIEKIGQFDENYFLWFEEVDFCKRAKDKGLKIMYLAGTSILHQKGESFAKLPAVKKQYIYLNSLYKYFKKHGQGSEKNIILFLAPLSLFLALVVNLIETFKTIKRDKNK